MNPWLGIVLMLAALAVVMGVAKLAGRFTAPEVTRKLAHVSMGLVMLALPWVFNVVWPVAVLCGGAIAALAAVRFWPPLQRRMGSVLGGVERKTYGEFYFAVGILLLFMLARDDKILYCIPVLILTLADTAGALVGTYYGMAHYRTDDGFKTAEGSLSFFTTAFLSCHVPLLLCTETGRAQTLLISLTAGFTVMLLEAVVWRGQDNLIIPVAMYFLLKLFLPLSVAELLVRFGMIVSLVLVALAWRKRTTLSDSAVLVCALSAYAVWGFWRWTWLIPLMLLFFIYVCLPRFPSAMRPMQNFHAVTQIMAGAFLWMMIPKIWSGADTFAPFVICVAAHAANTISSRLRVVRGHWPMRRVCLIAWGVSVVVFGAFAAIVSTRIFWQLPVAIALSLAVFIPLWSLDASDRERHPARRWFAETCVAVIVSTLGLL